MLATAGIQVYPLYPVVDVHVIPESKARPCTHSAVCAPEGSDVQEPPTALHVSSQFPPAADICHCLPVPPQLSSGLLAAVIAMIIARTEVDAIGRARALLRPLAALAWAQS